VTARQSRIEVGVVTRPHGVRGALRVRLHNPASEALARAREVVLAVAGNGGELRLGCRQIGRQPDGVLLALDGVADRSRAEELRGARVLVERGDLEPLGEAEYLCADLVGCRVEDERGRALGEVVEVMSAGASDVLVVRDGRLERMIPFVDHWVADVDLEARLIRVEGGDQWEAVEV
jgi:16S rRNA processing protein RimM